MARATCYNDPMRTSGDQSWFWPNSTARTQPFAVGSSVHNNLPNHQEELFPWNSLQKPSSFDVNNIGGTIGSSSNNINYLRANQQDCVVPLTNEALGINTFVGKSISRRMNFPIFDPSVNILILSLNPD